MIPVSSACDLLRVSIEAVKTYEEWCRLQTDLATHHEYAAQGYQSLQSDSMSLVLYLYTFDLQQNLPIPTLTHSAMFCMTVMGLQLRYTQLLKGSSSPVCVE